MLCPFCQHEAIKNEFTKANGCPACGYALDNFYAEAIKCSICNDEGNLTRSLYVQIFPERESSIPPEAFYVACDCSLDDEDDEEEIITWQQGQPLYEGQQYYFCKYGNFVLTLVTNSQYSNFVHTLVSNFQLTRTEAYLGNQRIYVVEEEVSPEEATRKLQEFLSTLANQLQILSHIEFEEESK